MKITSVFMIAVLAGWTSRAVAGTLVYIPQDTPNEVLVVDSATDTVQGKIVGMGNVHGLSGTVDGKYLFAGSYDETTPDKSMPPKPKGVSESDHKAHHAKRAETVTAKDGSLSYVSVIRVKDYSVVRRIAVPGAVHHAATTPDGRYAIMTHPNGDGISIIDTDTFKVKKTVATGPVPNYVAAGRDSKNIYVSNEGNNTISEVDTENWFVRRNILVGKSPEHLVISADGERLFVNNAGDGTVSVVSLRTGAVVKTYAIGGEVHGIDISDDGNTLYVAAKEKNQVVAIDLETGKMRATALSPSPYHLTVIRGTGKIYVSSADKPKIWVVGQRDLRLEGEIPIRGTGHQMVVGQNR